MRMTAIIGAQALDIACGWPPWGSDITRKTARPPDVTDADTQAVVLTPRRSHSTPITSENTNSSTRIDCTTESRPL